MADTRARSEAANGVKMTAPPQPRLRSVPPATTFPLLRLPLEIQHQICSVFCRHCSGPSLLPSATLLSDDAEDGGSLFTTLKALSEASNCLKDVAQPILYHLPIVKRYTPFFKTVIARPELAASVKVLGRLYGSRWRWVNGPPLGDKEDFAYLIELAQRFKLNDDPDADECVDHWAEDDDNFKRCFQYFNDTSDGDQIGYTMDMAHQSYLSLLVALHFAILPKLKFATIDLYDGMRGFGSAVLNSGQLQLSYPYLPKVTTVSPDHFAYIDTIVFRNLYHFQQDRLGLERIAFVLSAIPNVRVAFFEFLRGEKPEGYQEPQLSAPIPELEWPALSHLEEIYFDPCARERDPAPLTAISNLVQRCAQLKKLVYRHKFPNQYKPVLFSPAELVEAIVAARDTLIRLEMYCSNAKIPAFPSETLIDYHLKGLVSLTTLALDEELFCHHWLPRGSSDDGVCLDTCLVNILPENVSSLTVRLHDKFKAVPDIIRLGHDIASGYSSKLSFLQVHVLNDVAGPGDHYNFNTDPDAFDEEYFLYAVEPEQWEEALQALADRIRPDVLQAFDGTDVAVKVDYLYEVIFSYLRRPYD